MSSTSSVRSRPTSASTGTATRAALQSATSAYPGDAYVDIIGLDVYDKGIPVAWNSATKSWVDPDRRVELGRCTNLRFQRDFAIAHGKQVSYPEWGLSGVNATDDLGVGGDNPTFIQGMYDWMNGLPASGPGSLAYHSYFNEDAVDGTTASTPLLPERAAALPRGVRLDHRHHRELERCPRGVRTTGGAHRADLNDRSPPPRSRGRCVSTAVRRPSVPPPRP